MSLQPIDETNADQRAAATLEQVKQNYGFIPNMLGIMAHAPAVLESYLDLTGKLESSSLSGAEQQTILLAASRVNACDYCMAAHGKIAKSQGVPDQAIRAISADEPIEDAKLEAIRRFAQALVQTQGHPEDSERQAFVDAGYTEAQMLEVVLGVALKTLSNYTNHLTDPAIDKAFDSAD